MANGQGQQQPVADWQDYKPSEQGWDDYKPPNLRTGAGMQEQSVAQSREQMQAPVLRAAMEHEAKQKLLGERMNRASRSPMPLTDAAMAYTPAASARMLIGGKVGGWAGGKLAPKGYEQYGELAGGLAGGLAGDMAGAGSSAKEPLARVARAEGGKLRPSVRAASKIIGGGAGYAGGSVIGHPYAGGAAGYTAGPALADMVFPNRAAPAAKAASEATEVLKGNPTPFGSKQILSIPEATSSATVTGNAQLPKARMSATETGEYLKSQGQSVGRLKEDINEPAPEPSSYMKRKIDEAEGRHDARRMAATGAARGEDSRVGGDSSQTSGEARPVPRKARNLQTPKAKLKDEIAEKGGEDRLEQLRRGASGEPPAVKSVRRKFEKRETKLENRP